MAFGDVFAGWEKAAHEHQVNLLQMDYQNKRQLAENYAKLADDPKYNEEQRAEFQRRALHIPTLEPGKKMPKEYESMTLQVQPPQPSPISAPGSPGAPPTPADQSGQPQGYATAEINPQTVQPPTPPAHELNLMQPMPFDEQMRRATAESIAKGAGSLQNTIYKAAIPAKVGVGQGPDGRRYPIYRSINPVTGQREESLGTIPVGFFAPRVGQPITAGELAKWQSELEFPVMTEDGKDIDIQKIAAENPDSLWTPISEGRFRPSTEAKSVTSAGGQQVTYGKITGKSYGSLGQSNSTLPTVTNQQRIFPGLVDNQGNPFSTTTTSTRERTLPPSQITAPPLPPMRNMIPGPTAENQGQFDPNVINGIANARSKVPGPTNFSITPPVPSMAPYPGSVKPQTPSAAGAPAPPPVSAPKIGAIDTSKAMTSARFAQVEGIGTGMKGIAAAIVRDPMDPNSSALERYASLASNPKTVAQMGAAFQTLQQIMGQHGSDPSIGVSMGLHLGVSGDIAKILSNVTGISQAAVQSDVNRVQSVLSQLPQNARNGVSSILGLFAVLPAMRQVSKNPVYTAAMNRLETEIPTFFNTTSPQDFYQKLGLIMRELTIASTTPDMVKYMGDAGKEWGEARDRYFAFANMKSDELKTVNYDVGKSQWLYKPSGSKVELPIHLNPTDK